MELYYNKTIQAFLVWQISSIEKKNFLEESGPYLHRILRTPMHRSTLERVDLCHLLYATSLAVASNFTGVSR